MEEFLKERLKWALEESKWRNDYKKLSERKQFVYNENIYPGGIILSKLTITTSGTCLSCYNNNNIFLYRYEYIVEFSNNMKT